MTHSHTTVIPTLRYQDAPAAMAWLCDVFGFSRHAVYEGLGGTIGHAELTLGGGMIMLGSKRDDAYSARFRSPQELGGETCGIFVVVADIDAVYQRAQAAGSDIRQPLQDTEYGSREFSLLDPEGHTWSVGTYDPWQVPAN